MMKEYFKTEIVLDYGANTALSAEHLKVVLNQIKIFFKLIRESVLGSASL